MIIPYIASDLREVSPTVLAYIGDSVYELYARCHVANKCAGNNNRMHKKNVGYVSATAQAKAMRILEEELDEVEESYFRRGRNSNPHSSSKNANHGDYMYATGFETLIGFLFLDNRSSRLEYIISRTFEILDAQEG